MERINPDKIPQTPLFKQIVGDKKGEERKEAVLEFLIRSGLDHPDKNIEEQRTAGGPGWSAKRALKRVLPSGMQSPAFNRPVATKQAGLIYVPTIKRYVTRKPILLGNSYDEAQESIMSKPFGYPMSILTPDQFKKFLRYLRDSDVRAEKELFDQIAIKNRRSRGTLLNAKFEKNLDGLYLISENILVDGEHITKESKLKDYCRKKGFVSLDEWIDSPSGHSLPYETSSEGHLMYYPPNDREAMRFSVGKNSRTLSMQATQYSDPSVGVFACAEEPK